MAHPTLYITRPLPAPVMATLRERYTLVSELTEDQIPTDDDRRYGFSQADAVICTLADPITDALLAAAPRLKVVANYAVGYNNIDVAAATRRGIVVTNTPDVLTDATADLTWALILAGARRVVEGDLGHGFAQMNTDRDIIALTVPEQRYGWCGRNCPPGQIQYDSGGYLSCPDHSIMTGAVNTSGARL